MKKLFLQIFSILSLITSPAALFSAAPHFDFTEVAEKSIPAVVSIKVEIFQNRAPKGAHPFGMDGQNDFSEEFFQRFFGLPKRSEPSHREVEVGLGSGFIVSNDGFIITNHHVVKEAESITVSMSDGRKFDAKLIGSDASTDLAVIKVESEEVLPYLTLADSDQVKVGEWVVAIGNPLGLQASLTAGVVSAKGRSMHAHPGDSFPMIQGFIQTDAAINRGNSGGPLINLDNKVVGINAAIVSNTGGYMGIGFAIPSSRAAKVMEQLIENGSVTRGFLGLTLQTVDQDLADAFHLKKIGGVLVTSVIANSPSEKAGLKQGDLILEYNDTKVESDASIRNTVILMTPGSKIKLKVLRDKEEKVIEVIIGTHPDDEDTAGDFSQELGIEIEKLTAEAAQALGYINESGVIVTKVLPGSVAAMADIRRGTLIIAVNHQKIAKVEEFYNALEKSSLSKRALLLVKQGQLVRYVTLKLPK